MPSAKLQAAQDEWKGLGRSNRAASTPERGTCPVCPRVTTSERKPYPCFTAEDFPAVYEAAQAALKRAQQAAVADSSSMVPAPDA